MKESVVAIQTSKKEYAGCVPLRRPIEGSPCVLFGLWDKTFLNSNASKLFGILTKYQVFTVRHSRNAGSM